MPTWLGPFSIRRLFIISNAIGSLMVSRYSSKSRSLLSRKVQLSGQNLYISNSNLLYGNILLHIMYTIYWIKSKAASNVSFSYLLQILRSLSPSFGPPLFFLFVNWSISSRDAHIKQTYHFRKRYVIYTLEIDNP